MMRLLGSGKNHNPFFANLWHKKWKNDFTTREQNMRCNFIFTTRRAGSPSMMWWGWRFSTRAILSRFHLKVSRQWAEACTSCDLRARRLGQWKESSFWTIMKLIQCPSGLLTMCGLCAMGSVTGIDILKELEKSFVSLWVIMSHNESIWVIVSQNRSK